MFFPEGQVRVHLYGRPVDMRRSFDGLYALTRQELGEDPMSGSLFVFINRRATQMKVPVLGSHGILCVGQASGAGALCVGLGAGVDYGDGLDRVEAVARRHRAEGGEKTLQIHCTGNAHGIIFHMNSITPARVLSFWRKPLSSHPSKWWV